jgi:hypothetical protein
MDLSRGLGDVYKRQALFARATGNPDGCGTFIPLGKLPALWRAE